MNNLKKELQAIHDESSATQNLQLNFVFTIFTYILLGIMAVVGIRGCPDIHHEVKVTFITIAVVFSVLATASSILNYWTVKKTLKSFRDQLLGRS